jgi:hypothetical protein
MERIPGKREAGEELGSDFCFKNSVFTVSWIIPDQILSHIRGLLARLVELLLF